ncbi:uncharacterized protein [Parasteatoda tepidariorum]|uniref:uncharacterized protein n=1 Tax=Parasteatoda tepidariorum TaxID=114398 RepID=UPI001C717C71|nr:integrator complex subunit 3 homolog [Parasteatoda tepidariorum]
MVSVLIRRIAIIISFVHLIQAQRPNEAFNSYGGQPQNIQTGPRNQPPPQFNGQQRWTPPNQQPYNNGFQRASPGTLGAESNRPYSEQFQQGPPRTNNNLINRPYIEPPRPIETTGNGYNRPPVTYGGYQRGPQLSPGSNQNRQAINGPQRPLIAIDNNRPNSQPQRVANNYGQNVFNQQRPSFATDNLRNRPIYYRQRGPARTVRNESNAPIYIRRAQSPPPTNNELNRPIYNVGGPIRVLDNDSNRPINLNGFQPNVPISDAGLNKQTNLVDINKEEQTETNNDPDTNEGVVNNAPRETPPDQLKSVSEEPKSSSNSKPSSIEINKESSNSNGSTLSLIEKSDKTKDPENSTLQKQKPMTKLEVTTPSNVQNLSSLNTETEKSDSTEETSSEQE